MTRLLVAFLLAAVASLSSVAHAQEALTIEDCKKKGDPIEVVWCEVRFHGDVHPCDTLSTLDSRLFCMAMARKSASGCNQVMDDELQARCYRDIGVRAGSGHTTGSAPKTGVGSRLGPSASTSAGAGYSVDPPPTAQTSRSYGASSRGSTDTSKCDAESGEQKLICMAKTTRNADHCNSIGHHDNKLYCYAVVRGSAGGCDQVMDDGLKARCHAEVRNR